MQRGLKPGTAYISVAGDERSSVVSGSHHELVIERCCCDLTGCIAGLDQTLRGRIERLNLTDAHQAGNGCDKQKVQ
ncbi:hypothetical protein ALO43_200172 [Pseudomonas tremae]|uniref:Uncharacterized protein n=1 Tax=Pseudomonas tremae TaxID=200454 RepID=A0AA40P2F2_9PSED|nr:hypothetical protein ALO43_200172 [Pseudomonas tremae]